jgi:hypothetical protein
MVASACVATKVFAGDFGGTNRQRLARSIVENEPAGANAAEDLKVAVICVP